MIGVLATALLVIGTSLVVGWALLSIFGRTDLSWLAAPVGLAALIVVAPALVRLPGRATTSALVIGLGVVALLLLARRSGRLRAPAVGPSGSRSSLAVAASAVVLTIALACLPFAIHEEAGVLGEGVYTNDQAAQLHWAEWLRTGFGPEPTAVGFGYPTGPHAVSATAAEMAGTTVERAFNGLMIAIPGIGALAALAALGGLAPVRRLFAAVVCGLPFLGASWLAQSGFKETAMAVFVVAAAVALLDVGRGVPRRATLATLLVLAAAGAFTLSPVALAWFAGALAAWALMETLRGRPVASVEDVRRFAARHRRALLAAIGISAIVAGVAVAQLGAFADRLDAVTATFGRLDSPVFWGQALGIWPEGDFRLVRGQVEGAVPATLFGLALLGWALWISWRRGETALVAVTLTCAMAYVAARVATEIHVEAKTLAIMAPLVALAITRGLMSAEPRDGRPPTTPRLAAGALYVTLALASSFLALREAPVGFGERAAELEELAQRAQGERLLFLGLDRFSAYEMRGTLLESPGGYVPRRVRARPEKPWQQGMPLDFDTVAPEKLDRFRYAVTTSAAHQSTAPPSFDEVARTESFVLWRRGEAESPERRVLADEEGDPGARLDCATREGRRVLERAEAALVMGAPVVLGHRGWPGGQPYPAPVEVSREVDLEPGSWHVSLQYHSQVELEVEVGGEAFRLPPTLTGMYHTSPGRGSFWRVGEVAIAEPGPVTVTARGLEPGRISRLLDAPARVWLGDLALTPEPLGARQVGPRQACGEYVDGWLPRTGAPRRHTESPAP